MSGSWWFRMGVVVATLLASAFVLLPNFVGQSAAERIAEQAQQVDSDTSGDQAAEQAGGWRSLLPDTRLQLGLDLQGGIDLTLDVEVEEAVLSSVSRDIQTIRGEAERQELGLEAIERVRGKPALDLVPSQGTTLDQLRDLMTRRFTGYVYTTTTTGEDGRQRHRFELSEDRQRYISQRAVEQAVETLRNRVDATGVKEPSIVRKGENRINVQLPGIDNLQQAVTALGYTAVLEFFLLDEEYDEAELERAVLAAREALSPEDFQDDDLLNDWLVDQGRIPSTDRLLWEYKEDAQKKLKRSRPYVLKDQVVLTGDDVNDASVSMNQFNEPYVSLEFKPAGGRVFAEITGENVGKRFAIVLDRKVRSAPVIREKISGGRASIEMGAGDYQKTLDEASMLALVLRTGALPAPVSVGEVRTVGASLGADSIDAGVDATVVGGILVVFFMLLYYRRSGVIANVALGMNLVFIMALLAAFGATLTLPGIAGIALTVGMAVDANIIIFERIREELRLGKAARSAVDSGFDNALSAVLDANITTAIAGVVLFSYGTGPIKGFAVTLLIGILTTLYSAIFVSRTFMDLMVRKRSVGLGL